MQEAGQGGDAQGDLRTKFQQEILALLLDVF